MDTVRAAAAEALRRGWQPVRISPDTKAPRDRGWQNRSWEVSELAAFDGHNVGIRLDPPLVDIDLDCDEAVSFGGLLPPTDMIHGRSDRARHYWYRVSDERSVKTVFSDPFRMESDGEMTTIAEWRTGKHQTVIPPSTHPNGTSLHWKGPGLQWGDPAEVSYDHLMTRLKWVVAGALMARYWPSKGDRHTADLAYAGGIAQLGCPELSRFAPSILSGAARVAGDDEWDTRGHAAWKTTQQALAKGQTVTSWGSLVTQCNVPKPVVDRIEELLTPTHVEDDENDLDDLDESLGGFDHRQSTETLREIVLSKHVPTTQMLVPGVLYRESVTWLVGKAGDGKTMLALYLMKVVIEQGGTAVLFDEESGLKRIARRMIPFDLTEDQINRFHYYETPGANFKSQDSCNRLVQQIEALDADLIVFDSTADILTNSGYDENSNYELNTLYNTLMLPLKNIGCAVLTIDHQAKSAFETQPGQNSSTVQTARGAGSKLSKADVQWNFTGKLIKNTPSSITLVQAKDRDGDMPQKVHYHVNGNDSVITFERTDSPGKPSGDWVPGIVSFLRRNARGKENAVFTQKIKDGVPLKGDAAKINAAFKWLQSEDGQREESIMSFKDGSRMMYFFDPAIEMDFSDLVPEDEEDE